MAAKNVNDSSAGKVMIGEYVKNIKAQAEELVMVKFPQIAVELDELFKTTHFNIGDKTSAYNELKMTVPDLDSWNRDIDGFISTLTQKLAVSSDSLTRFSDHARWNKYAENAKKINIRGKLSVDNDMNNADNGMIQTADSFSGNLNVDECFPESKKLTILSNSILSLADHVRCPGSDVDNFNAGDSEHKKLERSAPDLMNHGTESVTKVEKPSVVSDLELGLTDRIRCKKHIVDVIQLMKAIASRLLEDIQFLKMWIQFLTPRKEDADSLIESILNDIILKMEKVETKAKEFSTDMSRYFYFRSFVIKRYMKYPQVNDYEYALQEFDEENYCKVRYFLCEFRNFYATLHDMISKNIKELKKSRTFNPNMMY